MTRKKPQPKKHQQFKIQLKDKTAAARAANQAKIAEQEARVRAGLLRPVELGLGNGATQLGNGIDDWTGDDWDE